MPHKKIASNRVFLNTRDSDCMAACMWNVQVYYPEKVPEGEVGRAELDANWGVNDEAKNHWLTRKAHLKPIRNVRAELDKFEQAIEDALVWIEDNGYKLGKGEY